jgi:putative endonuclease
LPVDGQHATHELSEEFAPLRFYGKSLYPPVKKNLSVCNGLPFDANYSINIQRGQFALFVTQSTMPWFLYLLECEDFSIYTGIALDVEKRLEQHRQGKGARYTRAHPPKRLLATVRYPNRSEAAKAEYEMKQKTAAEKRAFCRKLARLSLP